MLTYKKKGGDRIRRSSKKKPKKVETGKRSKKIPELFKIPNLKRKQGSLTLAKISLPGETTPDQAKSKGKTEDTTVSEARESPQANMKAQRSKKKKEKRGDGRGWRRVLRLTYKKKLPPLLPIFTKPTSTLSHAVGRFLPKTRLLTLQQIRELSFNRKDGQKTYLLFGHGDPLLDMFDRPEKFRRGKNFFKKMRFGVTANDGGSCYSLSRNHTYYFEINEHTLGYETPKGVSVTAFERRYPVEFEGIEGIDGELEFPNFRISEGYWGESNFFPSGIWRVSKGKIELFGITEVAADEGFVNGIDLTQDDAESAKQGFLTRFTDGRARRPSSAGDGYVKLETLLDIIHADAGDAEVVNVLIQTCSGIDTTKEAGREVSEAWKGRSEEYRPYKF